MFLYIHMEKLTSSKLLVFRDVSDTLFKLHSKHSWFPLCSVFLLSTLMSITQAS